MEKLVLTLCGIWLWLTRRSRTTQYSRVANSLQAARTYLWTDYTTRASTQDRGALLPEHSEALRILDRQAALAVHTSSRFASISECRKLIWEELSPSQKAA